MSSIRTREQDGGSDRAPRLLAVASAVTLLVAVAASLWRVLAAQSPSSPLHVGPLLGPIDSLADACWIAGFGGLALASVIAAGLVRRREATRAAALLGIGWALVLAGLILGAVAGTTGVQIIKAYPRTVAALLMKMVGCLGILSGVAYLAAGLLRRRGDRPDG